MASKYEEYSYVVQIETRLDKKGHWHQKCYCTLPVQAIADMGLFADDAEDRTVRVRYNKDSKTLIIQKAN